MKCSEYIIYVDESGDHGLMAVDPQHPVFVLSFCIFRQDDYATRVVPAIINLKFKYFGHDMVVLHERDIRKRGGAFAAFSPDVREEFLESINQLIQELPFTVVAVVIDKQKLIAKYPIPQNPYNIALRYGIERAFLFLKKRQQAALKTFMVFEARGKKEDCDLELEFRRTCSGQNSCKASLPFEPVFVSKHCNSSGLQLADMTARPIGLSILRPNQPNRAVEIIKQKMEKNVRGGVEGFGLKVFP